MILGFSVYPFKMATLSGFGLGILGFLLAIGVVIEYFMFPGFPRGCASAAFLLGPLPV